VQLKPRADGREGVKLRRIKVELDKPTRHGETELYLLSSVPEVSVRRHHVDLLTEVRNHARLARGRR
jgi:hypothetical protein